MLTDHVLNYNIHTEKFEIIWFQKKKSSSGIKEKKSYKSIPTFCQTNDGMSDLLRFKDISLFCLLHSIFVKLWSR